MAFMQAMMNSILVAPLISWDTLKRMTILTDSSACDNVLLEWSLALELSDRFGTKILPLLLGSQLSDDEGNTSMTDFFAEKPPQLRQDGRSEELDEMGLPVADKRSLLERVPNVVVASVYERLDEFFAKKGQPSCAKRRSASKVVAELTCFKGIQVWDIKASHGGSTPIGALAQYERWGRAETLAVKVRDVVLACVEGTSGSEGAGARSASAVAGGAAGAGVSVGVDGSKRRSCSKTGFRASAVSTSMAVLLEGTLMKRSTGALRRWQRRYFVVGGHYLKYADNEDAAHSDPKATMDLHALQTCTIKRGTFVTLCFTDKMLLELQALSLEEAEGWHEVLAQFEGRVAGVRKTSVMQSLEHYAPRKGTLVFIKRKASFERKSGGLETPAPAPAPSANNSELAALLTALDLSEYLGVLVGEGYDKTSDLEDLGVEELVEEIGMKKGHAKRLAKHFK
jgi:hypothetical protein